MTRTWTHMDEMFRTWTHMDEVSRAWTHMDEMFRAWTHMDEVSRAWTHMDEVSRAWIEVSRVWTHMDEVSRPWVEVSRAWMYTDESFPFMVVQIVSCLPHVMKHYFIDSSFSRCMLGSTFKNHWSNFLTQKSVSRCFDLRPWESCKKFLQKFFLEKSFFSKSPKVSKVSSTLEWISLVRETSRTTLVQILERNFFEENGHQDETGRDGRDHGRDWTRPTSAPNKAIDKGLQCCFMNECRSWNNIQQSFG